MQFDEHVGNFAISSSNVWEKTDSIEKSNKNDRIKTLETELDTILTACCRCCDGEVYRTGRRG